jgi:hypothetical protein
MIISTINRPVKLRPMLLEYEITIFLIATQAINTPAIATFKR